VIYLFLRRGPRVHISRALSLLPISLIGTLAPLMRALGSRSTTCPLLDHTRRRPLRRRRRHRDAREHPCATWRGACRPSGGRARLQGDGPSHLLDLGVAGRVLIPHLLHAGRDRLALPRGSLSLVSLADHGLRRWLSLRWSRCSPAASSSRSSTTIRAAWTEWFARFFVWMLGALRAPRRLGPRRRSVCSS